MLHATNINTNTNTSAMPKKVDGMHSQWKPCVNHLLATLN